MDQRQVVAEWAWISKEPGSHEDYGILAASTGPIEAGGFAGAYVAGVPSSAMPENASAAPPWVTFGSHLTSADRPLLSVSVQDPWHGQDQARRPIWPRRFFLCRYDDLAAARASYRTVWDAVAPVGLPRPDRQPIPVAVRPQPLRDVVAAINDIGFDHAAAIAAALLDGPVSVTETAGLRLQDPARALDRLAVLDAVAALLPYGFRADLSGSTAVDNTVVHRMRLLLAEYAKDGQQAAPLRGAPVTPRSELARDYLTMLLDKERWDGLNMVVAYLWDATSACSFGCAETALEILDGLNRHRHKIRAAKSGAESLKLSRAFFRDEPSQVEQMWRSSEMDEQMRNKLLRPFLEADDRQLAETLPWHWDVVADDCIALVNHRLNDGDIGGAMRSLAVAESQPDAKAADRLLRKLVCPPPLSSESWPRSIETRAELLRQRAVPAPDTFGMTCIALRLGRSTGWQAQLVRELLAGEITADPAGDRVLAWASWLSGSAVEGEASDWVTALGYLLVDPGGNGVRDSVRSLIQQDAIWATIALELARRSGRLHDVLGIPSVADDLIGHAAAATQPGQEETRRMLASAVRVPLWEHDLDPAMVAAVDAARMLLDDEPSGFPDHLTQPQLSRYDEGLRRVLGLPSVRAAQPPLVTRFLGQMARAGSPQPLSDGTVWLLQAWSEDERLAPVLAGFTAASGAATALVRDRRLTHDFWCRLEAVQPALRPALAISRLRGAIEQTITDPSALNRYADERFGVTGSKPALAMYRAWKTGMPAAQIIEAIRDTSVKDLTLIRKISHSELDDVLRECEFLLACPARDAEDAPTAAEDRRTDAGGALREFRELICAGALGAGYGAEFWRSLNRRLRDEEAASRQLRRRLRRWFRPAGRRRTRPSASVPAVVPAREE